MSQKHGKHERKSGGQRSSKGKAGQHVHISEHHAHASSKKPIFPAFAPSQCEMTDGYGYKPQANASDLYDTTQLYVSNLPPKTNMEEVSKLFPECVSIRLGVNNSNDQLAAYLEFPDSAATERASYRARGACIRGQYLIVSPKLKCN